MSLPVPITETIATDALARARDIIGIEAEGLRQLAAALDDSFLQLVEACLACTGRVILLGMGKSGLVARKITATLQSLATPAYFLSPAEGFHGDLGLIQPEDLILLISNSGSTDELVNLLPGLRRLSGTLVAITGQADSPLARGCDIVCNVGVAQEADAHGLVPSASTTALMAFGDALALVLFEKRGLTIHDFAARHPGGQLGKRLLLRVSDLAHTGEAAPTVAASATFGDAIDVLTRKHLGAVVVVAPDGRLGGFLTDGDVRRIFDQTQSRTIAECFAQPVAEVMTKTPATCGPDELAVDVMARMRQRQHQQTPVVDGDGMVVGLVRLLDLVQAGL